MIEKLAEGIRRSGPASLLAVDGVQRLVDEEAEAAAERYPPRHLPKEEQGASLLKSFEEEIILPKYLKTAASIKLQ